VTLVLIFLQGKQCLQCSSEVVVLVLVVVVVLVGGGASEPLLHFQACWWWEMPGDIDYEICQTALELLSDLCSRGEVQNDHCLDFIYYFRDLARPRHTDSGEEPHAAP